MPATMSLLGLYNWDEDILEGMEVPDGVDKTALIHNLLRECAELEILYPQPDALKFFVKDWSKERLPVWTRLEATLHYEYDPISNYDRHEEWNNEANSSAKTAGYNSDDSDVPDASSEGQTSSKGRAYGNIGVTTTQDMIEQERRVSNFDIIDVIIAEFKKTFCLLVY